MSTTTDDYYWDLAYEEYGRAEYESKLIEDALRDISYENVRYYLGTYGDSIEARINRIVKESESLIEQNYYAPSLVLSTTAIEIIIRFFIIRPLLQGAFLSEDWASLLSGRIAYGKTSKDREIVPLILKLCDIDIDKYNLSDNRTLWDTIFKNVIIKRNFFVHKGEPVDKEVALLAMECVKKMLGIVFEISDKYGFTLGLTGKWSAIKEGYDSINKVKLSMSFKPLDAF